MSLGEFIFKLAQLQLFFLKTFLKGSRFNTFFFESRDVVHETGKIMVRIVEGANKFEAVRIKNRLENF